MKSEFEARITLVPLPLSRASIDALRHLGRYDVIVFTSKHAQTYFEKELLRCRIALPDRSRIIRVGPRNHLLKLALKGKRILFPRSGAAPFDTIRKLRKIGSRVRVIPLYLPKGVPLTSVQKANLQNGKTKQLYFKSPSGIAGLLKQCHGRLRKAALSIPARCIGDTTAQAARKAGFKRVFIG